MSKRGKPAHVKTSALDRDGDGDVDADDAVKLLTDLVEKLGERLGDVEDHSYVKTVVKRIRALF